MIIIHPSTQRTMSVSGVYGLVDAFDPELVRYVGSSVDVEHRFYQHMRGAVRGKRDTSASAWLGRILSDGIGVRCYLLEAARWSSNDERLEHEALWIARAALASDHLLNRALLCADIHENQHHLTTSLEGGKAPNSLICKGYYHLTSFNTLVYTESKDTPSPARQGTGYAGKVRYLENSGKGGKAVRP